MTTPIAPLPPVGTPPVVAQPPAPQRDLGDFAKRMAIDTTIAAGVPAVLMAFPQVVNSLFGNTPEWASRADATTLGVALVNGLVQSFATVASTAGTYAYNTNHGPTQNVLTGAAYLTLGLGVVTAITYGNHMGMAVAATALTTGATLLQRLGYHLGKSRQS